MPKPLQPGQDGPSATPTDCEKRRAPAAGQAAGHVIGRRFFSPVFFGRAKKTGSPDRAKAACDESSTLAVFRGGLHRSICSSPRADSGSPCCFGLTAEPGRQSGLETKKKPDQVFT